MAEPARLPTIWVVPDDLWNRAKALIEEHDPPKPTGRKREDARKILNGILYRLRTSCQWNHLPKQYGDDSTVHRTMQRWVKIHLFELLWSLLVAECEALKCVQWQWQAADGWLGKAPGGQDQAGPNPTDRAKRGTKKSLLTDAEGGPLAILVAPANVNDHKLLEKTLEAIVVERPKPTAKKKQHLCLDKGYDNQASREIVEKHGYQEHIRRIGEEKFDQVKEKKHPARRYVVERTISWLSKCRGLLIRYERKSENYLAQLQFACALLWYRRLSAQPHGFP
jgi:putative transposase